MIEKKSESGDLMPATNQTKESQSENSVSPAAKENKNPTPPDDNSNSNDKSIEPMFYQIIIREGDKKSCEELKKLAKKVSESSGSKIIKIVLISTKGEIVIAAEMIEALDMLENVKIITEAHGDLDPFGVIMVTAGTIGYRYSKMTATFALIPGDPYTNLKAGNQKGAPNEGPTSAQIKAALKIEDRQAVDCLLSLFVKEKLLLERICETSSITASEAKKMGIIDEVMTPKAEKHKKPSKKGRKKKSEVPSANGNSKNDK